MPDVDLTALVNSLYARRHEGVVVPFEPQTITSGQPQEHDCHSNTDRYVRDHPDHKSVRGWMIFDYNKTTQGWWPVCRFMAHSVVEAPDGRLFDITPSQASQRYPFIRHSGPDSEFEAIVLAGHIHLDFVISFET
jgi:hypothetical protein